MIEIPDRTRRISPSRLHELLLRYDCKSLVDPFMGLPTHLNYLKRHGIAVHGGDLLDWFVRVGEGIVVNDLTILKDSEVAEIVEMLPGRIYSLDLFKAWEGVFFSEDQCAYLGVWYDNVRNLRSDGQTGLAILGLWRTFCYWIQKTQSPDDMQDIAPSELAWTYIRQTEAWVVGNMRRNTVRKADALATMSALQADTLFLAPPARNSFQNADARIWMWEAWWRGNPYFTIQHAYRDSLLGARAFEPASYLNAIATILHAAGDFPIIVAQTTEEKLAQVEPLLRSVRPNLEIVAPHAGEVYLVGRR